MLSLRAAAARTRKVTVSTSIHRNIANDPEVVFSPATQRVLTPSFLHQPDRKKRKDFPSTPVDNAPGWNEDLATPSEASIKADRESATMDEMMRKTVDYAQSHHHEVEHTHATYAREEVSGPLGNSGVGEFEGVVGNDDLGPDNDVQVESNGRVVTRRTTGGSGKGQV